MKKKYTTSELIEYIQDLEYTSEDTLKIKEIEDRLLELDKIKQTDKTKGGVKMANGNDYEIKEDYRRYYSALTQFHRWLVKNSQLEVGVGIYENKVILDKLIEYENNNGVEIKELIK